jgi:hypothetical protein
VTKEKLMFHNNNSFDEQDQLEEGPSRKQIKQIRTRKNKNKLRRALQHRDWELLEDVEDYNINVK